MKYRSHLLSLLLVMVCLPCVSAQNTGKNRKEPAKFHTTLDFHYTMASRQHLMGQSAALDDKSGTLLLSLLYSVSPKVQLGAGLGCDDNGVPIFAAGRYHPFGQTGWKDAYAFTNLGYSPLKVDGAHPGYYWDLGIGYVKMFKRRFGLTLQLAYNLRQAKQVDVYGLDFSSGNYYPTLIYLGQHTAVIHALTCGIGVVF